MKQKWKQLFVYLAIPVAGGILSALISGSNSEAYNNFYQPDFAPPAWVFPVVWSILYVVMGYASWLIATSGKPKNAVSKALNVYWLQLGVNLLWSVIFFRLGLYLTVFLWLLLLWGLILWTIVRFYRIRKQAGYLLIPYLLWVTFAGYLNYAIYLLN